jgi:hypothetical protein
MRFMMIHFANKAAMLVSWLPAPVWLVNAVRLVRKILLIMNALMIVVIF